MAAPVRRSFQSFIKHDHQYILKLLAAYRSGAEESLAEKTTEFTVFRKALQRHIRWEEEIFFPVFEDQSTQHLANPTRSLRQDHAEALKALEAIGRSLKDEQRDPQAEAGLVKILEAHTFKEEHLIYPHIDQHISPAAHAMIQKKMNLIRKEVDARL